MKTLFLMLSLAILFVTTNARGADCSDQDRDFSFPGLTSYQSEYVYQGSRANGCDCPATSDGSMYCSSECVTGGSIETPG
jgi:hypothetical protein